MTGGRDGSQGIRSVRLKPDATGDNRPAGAPSRMGMGVGHSKTMDRVSFEIEFNQHHWLIAYDPTVVTRLDRYNLRRLVLDDTPVRVFDVNLAPGEEPDVRMHAEVGTDNRF